MQSNSETKAVARFLAPMPIGLSVSFVLLRDCMFRLLPTFVAELGLLGVAISRLLYACIHASHSPTDNSGACVWLR